jgi:hypothetical protein
MMCSPLALVHALAIVGMVFAFIAAAIYDGKLASHFQQKHPGVWADLGRLKVMLTDGENSPSAAMHWYLLCGEHKELQDAKLNAMVRISRLWIALLLCTAVALMFVQDRVSIATYRACLSI